MIREKKFPQEGAEKQQPLRVYSNSELPVIVSLLDLHSTKLRLDSQSYLITPIHLHRHHGKLLCISSEHTPFQATSHHSGSSHAHLAVTSQCKGINHD